MGHGIPSPYGRVFVNLITASDNGLITREQGHKSWVCVCEAWKRDHPESYGEQP